MVIHVENISKSYLNKIGGRVSVLNDVSFSVDSNEFFSIIGPSGCGKTTLLKIIAGLESPDSGKVTIQTKEFQRIPIIWQDYRLLPWKKVSKNISLGLEFTGLEVPAINKKVSEYIHLMNLNGFEDYYPYQLSGGMKQRVAIARALALDTKILLMDEPFGSLDYQTKVILYEEVRKLQGLLDKTIIYVTHDVKEAIRFSKRVLVLSHRPGRVRAILDTKEYDHIFDSKKEEDIWEMMYAHSSKYHKFDDKDLQRIKEMTDKVEGWLTPEEGEFLYQKAKSGPGEGVIVEIGSWEGKSTIWLASGTKSGKKDLIYAIDPHKNTREHQKFQKPCTYPKFKKNIEEAGVADFIVPIIDRSENAVKRWDKPIRFLWVDGGHKYRNVKRDFLLWEPHLAKGGIIAFHDTIEWEGPRRVVEKYIKKSNKFGNLGRVGSTTFAEKLHKKAIFQLLKGS